MHPPLLAAGCFLVSLVSAAKNPKRGLAYAESTITNDINLAAQSNSVISWLYNWGTSPPQYLQQSSIPYIPMQWGAGGVENFAATVLASGAKTVLTFNEPDLGSQSNIEPAVAAKLYKQYIQPLSAQGIRLGAPAVTNGPMGRPWISSFLANCTDCTIDFIPCHWYGDGVGNFYDYIWQMHGQFPQYPLWVTEFASTSSDDAEVLDFLTSSIAYLDSLDWIEGYAWFAFFRQDGTSHYNLLDENGQLNALGQAYITS
ncbi:hypothetical protein H2248_007366 [Termitomyces sp. 'cryptogamus']|nr:hypothetical protein H2248_007366 [Termitomyces sp. 'cryptogamus']